MVVVCGILITLRGDFEYFPPSSRTNIVLHQCNNVEAEQMFLHMHLWLRGEPSFLFPLGGSPLQICPAGLAECEKM